jgi:hypothetical protein
MENFARILIALGILLIIVGGFVFLMVRLGLQPGHLPGDIRLSRQNFTCVIGLGTSLLLSILLTLALNLLMRWLNK